MVKEESDRLSVLRGELRRRLGAQRFELWLGPQTGLELSDDELRVICGSPAIAQWLRRNLQSILGECASQALGRSPAIVFVAAEAPTRERAPARRRAQTAAMPVEQQLQFAEITEPIDDTEQGYAAGATHGPAECAAPPAAADEPRSRPPRWSFQDFVVGDSNRLAAQAAREAAQQPGRFSPLLLYGPAGCGKSHLLSAVAQHARQNRGRLRVVQTTAEQFTSQFLEALEKRSLPGFRQKMRSLDVLAVDDVQFLGGKRATLEEMLYTIDALNSRGGQVMLASAGPAAELQSLSPELASRISAGLAVAIDPPDYQTRARIVRSAATRMRIDLGPGVVEVVAQQVVGSGRLLCGALNRLVAASMALQKAIDVELAGPAIADFCRQHSPQVRLVDIQRAVCEVFGVDSSSLKSSRKTRAIAEPRMLAMWLARRYTRAALSEIGDFFGRRSHSTVVSAQRKCDDLISRRGDMIVGDHLCQIEEAIRRIEARLRTA